MDENFKNDFDRMYAKMEHMDNQLTLLRIEVAGLKVKSGIWGFAAGVLPAIAFYLSEMFRR